MKKWKNVSVPLDLQKIQILIQLRVRGQSSAHFLALVASVYDKYDAVICMMIS